jgi:hypothetical protein
MKPDDLATILKGMPTDAAQKLTVKLANRLTLPATADAAPVQTGDVPSATAPAAAPAAAASEKPKN